MNEWMNEWMNYIFQCKIIDAEYIYMFKTVTLSFNGLFKSEETKIESFWLFVWTLTSMKANW